MPKGGLKSIWVSSGLVIQSYVINKPQLSPEALQLVKQFCSEYGDRLHSYNYGNSSVPSSTTTTASSIGESGALKGSQAGRADCTVHVRGYQAGDDRRSLQ